jgi:hypothetical protein
LKRLLPDTGRPDGITRELRRDGELSGTALNVNDPDGNVCNPGAEGFCAPLWQI